MSNEHLPKKIAVFPLSEEIFFPRTILPLNIFEKRYIQLVSDCMKSQRLFGMVQPKLKTNLKTEVYKVGCLGKITYFNETSDKRFLISLSGIVRFRIIKELVTNKLYREFKVDYSDFMHDLDNQKIRKEQYDVEDLFNQIKLFFLKKNYLVKFNELEKLNFDQLISTICMISPFSVVEKQKLIETNKMEEKIKVLGEIIKFNLVDNQKNKTIQ